MKRKALFVGIDQYTRGIPALSCARNDANALLEYFQRHSYEVSVLRDGSTDDILDALDTQTKDLKQGDVFLFFFAGHGYTIDINGVYDRRLAGAQDREDRIRRGQAGISLQELRGRANVARCAFVVILDACQTKIGNKRKVGQDAHEACVMRDLDLKVISAVATLGDTNANPFIVINSCGEGEVAYELEERNQGLFSFSLLETLKEMEQASESPAFDVAFLNRVAKRMEETKGEFKQHPTLFPANVDLPKIAIFGEGGDGTNPYWETNNLRNAPENGARVQQSTEHANVSDAPAPPIPPVSHKPPPVDPQHRYEFVGGTTESKRNEPVPAEKKAGEKRTFRLSSSVSMDFRWCPPGSFLMGSPVGEKERRPDEYQHSVTLSKGFWIAETPVLQIHWENIMGVKANRSPWPKGAEKPVTGVAYEDALEFIEKVRDTGLSARLPTEAEWEYACRAGSAGRFGTVKSALFSSKPGIMVSKILIAFFVIPFFGQLAAIIFLLLFKGRVFPVRQCGANRWGLHDMHGNCGEWCSDWYGAYPATGLTDPHGPETGECHVIRGMRKMRFSWSCRSATRWFLPNRKLFFIRCRHPLVGVRIVLDS